MAPGVLLTDCPEVVRGNKGGENLGSAVAVEDLLLAHSCRLHSSQAALDPRLTATPIISQSDRVAGAACLSPVLNHSISAAGGGGGGGEGGGRGEKEEAKEGSEISLFSKTHTSNTE